MKTSTYAALVPPAVVAIAAAVALLATIFIALTTGDASPLIEAGRSRP
ncbi:MAG: hypothetical protein ABWX92_03635 [Mycetocola sp.]